MGPRADTRPPRRIGGTEADKHTLTAPDLICFNLRRKTPRIKGKQREGGWKRGEAFFRRWNEKLMLQRSVKPSKGSALGQTTGGFFFIFFFRRYRSNYTVEEKDMWGWWSGGADVRQLSWGRWICRERAHNFKNFYIYDAKHAPLLHTRSPVLKDN